jgi:hypothetical protein
VGGSATGCLRDDSVVDACCSSDFKIIALERGDEVASIQCEGVLGTEPDNHNEAIHNRMRSI